MNKNLEFLQNLVKPLGGVLIFLFAALAIFLNISANDSRSSGSNILQTLTNATVYAENWFYQSRTAHLYKNHAISPNITAVVIDDESLNQIGRWPWSRKTVAAILEKLQSLGAKVIMFDIVFAESEGEEADSIFAKAISDFQKAGGTVVLGYGRSEDPEDAFSGIPDAALLSGINGVAGATPIQGLPYFSKNNFLAPKLQEAEPTLGFLEMEPDRDGVFRHSRILSETEKSFFPNLGFAGFTAYFSATQKGQIKAEPANPPDFRLSLKAGNDEHFLLVNPRGEVKVRYYGDVQSFEKIPAHVLLKGSEALQAKIKDKAVIIGSTALGAHDLRHTPVDPLLPGMFVHANLFHMFDQKYFFKSENESFLITILLFIFGSLLVFFLFRKHDPLVETGGTLLVAGGIFASDYFYFAPQGYFIRLFFTLFSVLGIYAWFTVWNVFKEAKEKKQIKDTFQRYVAPEIVKEMLANPEKLKVGGEKKEITMLFSDVRDFTTISERLTPMELATLLNIYMGKMTDILFETGGTLDKYIGDALVGFWGAPLDLKNHAYQAVFGAHQMLEALPAINKEFEKRKFPKINVGIGLNTGEVSVGNMGSDRIFQYTALGDNMNLASRLESLTKHYGVNLMISEYTYEKLGDKKSEFLIRPLDLVQVKGKSKAVKVFEVIPSWNPISQEKALLEKYESAYADYLDKKFAQAEKAFRELVEEFPEDKSSKRLQEAAEEYAQNPPASDWEGVTVMKTK